MKKNQKKHPYSKNGFFSVKIFREIFSWDFEGFARPKRGRIVETFSERFSVRIFVGDFFKILQKIHTENPTENKRTHFDILGRFYITKCKMLYINKDFLSQAQGNGTLGLIKNAAAACHYA